MEAMETEVQGTGQAEPKKTNRKGLVIVVACLVAAIGIGAGAFALASPPNEEEIDDGRIPYAEGVVILDETDVPKLEAGESIGLQYEPTATSTDGQTFSCMIANAARNVYDMYIDIYADSACTDEVYLSGLLPPGTALEEITLNHALPSGTNTVYVAFTQVKESEQGEQEIAGQITVTVDFIVS